MRDQKPTISGKNMHMVEYVRHMHGVAKQATTSLAVTNDALLLLLCLYVRRVELDTTKHFCLSVCAMMQFSSDGNLCTNYLGSAA